MSKQVQSSSAFCFNPIPKKSETMKEKIRIFNSTRPEIRREHLSVCDEKTEIKTGLVSEIVASFSIINNENARKNQVLSFNNLDFMGAKFIVFFKKSSKLEIPGVFKEKSSPKFMENKVVLSPVVDTKTPKEKENIYKEFEKYDERFSQVKLPRLNSNGGKVSEQKVNESERS